MSESRPKQGLPGRAILFFLTLALAVGGGTAWYTWQSLQSSRNQESWGELKQSGEVYWLNKTTKIALVSIPVSQRPPVKTTLDQKGKSQAELAIAQALTLLLVGPTDPATTTTIPQGTALRDVTLKADGVHIDVSQAFTTGGGSQSMMGRLGQLVYTATSLQAKMPVWISVEGKPLEVLGGEGIMLSQPMTRSTFDQHFGSIGQKEQ
jgi:spore germination protein GerM